MYPMKLIPVYKNYLWGGKKLEKIFNKKSDTDTIAESWELSCHEDGLSVVENGKFSGMTLKQVIEKKPQYVSNKYKSGDKFPIMVKFIDADKNLSVQVHPSDENAIKEIGESGKAEMWYTLDAQPGSYIYLGFKQKINRDCILGLVQNGDICKVMNKIYVNDGDVFYILPGTIHAIGNGCLIAEVQQNSNTTFRVYDYNRVDAYGKKRKLQLERAVEVLNYDPMSLDRIISNIPVCTTEHMLKSIFECSYLKVSKIMCKKSISLTCTINTFYSLLFIKGRGNIVYKSNMYEFNTGDSYFLPAGLGDFSIEGYFEALLSSI